MGTLTGIWYHTTHLMASQTPAFDRRVLRTTARGIPTLFDRDCPFFCSNSVTYNTTGLSDNWQSYRDATFLQEKICKFRNSQGACQATIRNGQGREFL